MVQGGSLAERWGDGEMGRWGFWWEFLWISIDFNGISIDFHRFLWNFDGFLWNFKGRTPESQWKYVKMIGHADFRLISHGLFLVFRWWTELQWRWGCGNDNWCVYFHEVKPNHHNWGSAFCGNRTEWPRLVCYQLAQLEVVGWVAAPRTTTGGALRNCWLLYGFMI